MFSFLVSAVCLWLQNGVPHADRVGSPSEEGRPFTFSYLDELDPPARWMELALLGSVYPRGLAMVDVQWENVHVYPVDSVWFLVSGHRHARFLSDPEEALVRGTWLAPPGVHAERPCLAVKRNGGSIELLEGVPGILRGLEFANSADLPVRGQLASDLAGALVVLGWDRGAVPGLSIHVVDEPKGTTTVHISQGGMGVPQDVADGRGRDEIPPVLLVEFKEGSLSSVVLLDPRSSQHAPDSGPRLRFLDPERFLLFWNMAHPFSPLRFDDVEARRRDVARLARVLSDQRWNQIAASRFEWWHPEAPHRVTTSRTTSYGVFMTVVQDPGPRWPQATLRFLAVSPYDFIFFCHPFQGLSILSDLHRVADEGPLELEDVLMALLGCQKGSLRADALEEFAEVADDDGRRRFSFSVGGEVDLGEWGRPLRISVEHSLETGITLDYDYR